MTDVEATMLLLSEKEARYAMTLQPGEFWAWWWAKEKRGAK